MEAITCFCGIFRILPALKAFERFDLTPCPRCGAPFVGIKLPIFGVWRLT